MKFFLPLLLLACLLGRPALAWEQAPWQDKLLSVSFALDYTHGWVPEGSHLMGPYNRAVPSFGLQTILRPWAIDFRASFDESFDLGVGWAQPLMSRWNGWVVLTALAVGRAAGREYTSATISTGSDHRFAFTSGPALRLEFLGYQTAWSVFLEARQMLFDPVETSLSLGVTVSPLAILQWRQRY
jgi:hypothetical protein